MKPYLLLLLCLCVSCSDDNFNNVETLGDFRVLAVIADPPEVGAAGGNVNLQLYVSDVKSGGRSFTGTTVSCVDPGISSGASVSCDHDPTRQTDTYTVDTTAGDPSGNLSTGLNTDVLIVNVPGQLLTGRSARDKFNGVGYITIFNFNVDGKAVKVFKRITVTSRADQNTNPFSSSIELNGSGFSGTPKKDDSLSISSSDQETYTYQNVDNSTEVLQENYKVAYFVSSGELNRPKADVGEKSKFTKGLESGQFVIISVIRDERGGVEIIRVP
jgi:hypothetical protein